MAAKKTHVKSWIDWGTAPRLFRFLRMLPFVGYNLSRSNVIQKEEPQSLRVVYFNCLNVTAGKRWPLGVQCSLNSAISRSFAANTSVNSLYRWSIGFLLAWIFNSCHTPFLTWAKLGLRTYYCTALIKFDHYFFAHWQKAASYGAPLVPRQEIFSIWWPPDSYL